jgi:HD-GYP domain-containing protein (c-di-GMP phosphodiesterase class II)
MIDTTSKTLSPSQLRELNRFGSRISKLGVNFAVCDCEGELVLLCEGGEFASDRQQLIEAALRVPRWRTGPIGQGPDVRVDSNLIGSSGAPVYRFGEENLILAAALDCDSRAMCTALIDLGNGALQTACMANRHVQYETPDRILSEMLGFFVESFQTACRAEQHIEMISAELAQTYEELVLLHKLSTNMKVTEADANFLQMACDSLTEIVSVEGIAILLEKTVEDERKLVLAAGCGLIDVDDRMAAILHSRLVDEINSGKEALLDSEVDSPFKYDWPSNIENIIAVPLYGKEKADSHLAHSTINGNCIIGLMVAINIVDKQDFDSTDVKLFNSVANGCAVFVENGRLFNDLKELFIGSLRALTSSIDAKDKYTRGHSERVAFISRWLAERFAEKEPLEQELINKIYLAGLLHDIGKIGIDEAVLRKEGKLTESEFDRIRTHPSIGASILGAIKQMRDVVPGVLCHHERMDGKGYPQGLAGEQIPLTGKIVGLADSFDAMISKRTYRDARTVDEALEEIRKGLGSQFDEKVATVFLDSDVYRLCDIMQKGLGEVYGNGNFSEYGTAAVGTLIR